MQKWRGYNKVLSGTSLTVPWRWNHSQCTMLINPPSECRALRIFYLNLFPGESKRRRKGQVIASVVRQLLRRWLTEVLPSVSFPVLWAVLSAGGFFRSVASKKKKKKKCCIEKNFRRCWFWVQGNSTHAITMTCASLVTLWSRIHLPKQETWVWSLGQEDPWERKWQPTLVFLPGKSHERKSLGGYSPWGLQRVGHNLATKQQQQ